MEKSVEYVAGGGFPGMNTTGEVEYLQLMIDNSTVITITVHRE